MAVKWFMFFLLFPCEIFAQQGYISGRITDSISHEPLAFVSIIYNHSGQGVVTNPDGIFRIPRSNKTEFLKIRYMGYKEKTLLFDFENFVNGQTILLSEEPVDINEVVVYPSENPAHRLIKLATDNRDRNNPEKSGPFSYISYDKMVFGLEPDSIPADSASGKLVITDTLTYGLDQKGKIDVQRFLDKQYLFMMESVTSRKYFSPQKNKEEIIANKVSGLSQPSFMVMAKQFQSFSFYENFINIAERQFLNPISPGSTDKYFFQIEDTLYSNEADTVFIISFRPMKGKNFDGMKGVLYINSNGYAIQNVLAEAFEQKQTFFTVSIQQQYDLINNQRWFPVLLSTSIRFNPAQLGYRSSPIFITGTGKSYIANIDFSPQYNPSEFSDVQIEVNPDAYRQSEQIWNKFRTDSLNSREIETYRVIDSLGKAEHLDRTITSFETLLTGYLPGRYWSFDIRRFIDYNPYEGLRLGFGGRTTPLMSKYLIFGGYLAYGLKDKAFKYSGNLSINLWLKHELEIDFLYRKDVHESGGIRFNESWTISGSSFIRDYMIEVMDKAVEKEISLDFRSLKYLTSRIYLAHSNLKPTNDYGFSLNETMPQVILTAFDLTEAGIKLKYSYKETFMKTPRGNKFSMGTKFPVFYFNLARGFRGINGNFTYWRTEMKVTKTFKTRSFGETRLAVISGLVTGEVPYSKLYAGRGSYRSFALETEQSFGTMRFNEFLSDRFIALFFKQDFGKLLLKPKGKFQPEIALVHNLGFGELTEKTPHQNIHYNTMSKGYYEGGILINNIFRMQFLRYGFGVLYRYGPYAYSKTIDNFAFKLSIQFNL